MTQQQSDERHFSCSNPELPEILGVLALRIRARRDSYHLAHSGIVEHTMRVLSDEIKALSDELRNNKVAAMTTTSPVEGEGK